MYEEILRFWFEELEPKQHFVKDKALDETIIERFGAVHQEASKGELASWRDTPEGALAEIIVLDQFSRNIHRDTPKAFAQDADALLRAQEMVARGDDMNVDEEKRCFVYMPYMHSESPEVHSEAVKLFEALGDEMNLKYEHMHKDIIDKFGRYPHRNVILGRESTPEELEFLTQKNSSF